MARSRKPTVWIEPRPPKPGPYRVRAEVNGRRLPDLPCGTNRRHAEQVRAEREAELWGKRLRIIDPEKLTLGQYAADYIKEQKTGKAENTVRIASRALDLLIEFAGTGTPLAAIDKTGVRDWKAWLLTHKYTRGKKGKIRTFKSNGARIIMRTARTAFRQALKDELLDRDPFFGVELPPEEDVAHPPTREEVHAMWPHVPKRSQRALTAAAFLGFRRSELFELHGLRSKHESRLKPPAVDPKCADCAKLGAPCPKEPFWARVKKAKTRRGKIEYKEVAVPWEALPLLEPIDTDGPLFDLSYRLLQSHLQKALKRAGLGRIRLHDFRHRWSTELLQAVKDEKAAMLAGGWVTRAALYRYQHESDERKRANLQVGGRINLPPPLPQNPGGEAGKKKGSPS